MVNFTSLYAVKRHTDWHLTLLEGGFSSFSVVVELVYYVPGSILDRTNTRHLDITEEKLCPCIACAMVSAANKRSIAFGTSVTRVRFLHSSSLVGRGLCWSSACSEGFSPAFFCFYASTEKLTLLNSNSIEIVTDEKPIKCCY